MSEHHLFKDGDFDVINSQSIMDKYAKSFSLAAKFLSPESKQNAAYLYAFARLADDLADEEQLGTMTERMGKLQQLKDSVSVGENKFANTSDPSILHLGKQLSAVIQDKQIDRAVLDYFITSLQTDAMPRQLQTAQDLITFSYGVAGTVGLMMRPILQAPKTSDAHAMALGIGMQLTNIARDVLEDARRQRCYIPAQWGINLNDLNNITHQEISTKCYEAVKKIVTLADDFYGFAQVGIEAIPSQNRRGIKIAMILYRAIGKKIVAQGASRYWSGRTSLTIFEKISLIAQCYLGTADYASAPDRNLMTYDLFHLAGLAGFPQIK